ncbi:MAG: hypothetical protein KGH64_04255 [Candidatus Micrarchaeota archaeon]|nr:hypothetical protein [Candidatus Micrarchaeota archaeon]
MMPEAYYYGCKNGTGHYWYAPDRLWMKKSDIIVRVPKSIGPYKVDGGFCIKGIQYEGIATVTHTDGWTVLSFWDRSIDRRGGSNSNFVVKGTHSFDDMVDIAKNQFADIWNRFKFEVKQ